MQLRGPVAVEDVFPDLLRVMMELEPSSTPTEVGTSLRDDAVTFVREGFDSGKWTTWADCHKLIEEHDCLDEALCEGLEAFGVDPDDSDQDEDEGEDDDDDHPGGGDDGPPAKDDGLPAEDGLPAKDDDDLGDAVGHPASHSDDGHADAAPGGGSDSSKHLASSEAAEGSVVGGGDLEVVDSKHSMEIAAARRLLYDEAVQKQDGKMLRWLRKQMQEETQKQKDASAHAGMLLRKRAEDERVHEAKRRRETVEVERLAAKNLEETKLLRAKAEQAAAEARLATLRQIIVNRRDADARKRTEAIQRAQDRWLQTQFPALLARRCIETVRGLSKVARAGFDHEVCRQLQAGTFERQLFIKDLWIADKSLTLEWSMVQPLSGGQRRQVRCGLPFQELLDKEAPQTLFGRDPVAALFRLYSAIVPLERRVFAGTLSPLRLLHVNDYILDKAFVYGIVALSKRLGEEWFPCGVFGQWPPPFPAGLATKSEDAQPVDLEASIGEDHLPPHLRVGLPASSSGIHGS